jgi:DNA-directed RNA polymerase specialized sigma24 family protein
MGSEHENWPVNVPRTAEELERKWGGQIDKWVARYNKVQVNSEDLRQEVRKTVYREGFCAKYVARLEKDPDPPDSMTMAQVLAFLGITAAAWRSRYERYRTGHVDFMPKSLNEHNACSEHAEFRTSDILELTDCFRDTGLPRKAPPPKSTDANFAGYLKSAIHNAVCNFIRTKKRREKERPFDTHYEFRNRATRMEEPVPYEEMLVDHHGSDIDVKADLQIALRKIATAVPAPHSETIIKSLYDGYKLQEAVRRLEVTNAERRSILVALRQSLSLSR